MDWTISFVTSMSWLEYIFTGCVISGVIVGMKKEKMLEAQVSNDHDYIILFLTFILIALLWPFFVIGKIAIMAGKLLYGFFHSLSS